MHPPRAPGACPTQGAAATCRSSHTASHTAATKRSSEPLRTIRHPPAEEKNWTSGDDPPQQRQDEISDQPQRNKQHPEDLPLHIRHPSVSKARRPDAEHATLPNQERAAHLFGQADRPSAALIRATVPGGSATSTTSRLYGHWSSSSVSALLPLPRTSQNSRPPRR